MADPFFCHAITFVNRPARFDVCDPRNDGVEYCRRVQTLVTEAVDGAKRRSALRPARSTNLGWDPPIDIRPTRETVGRATNGCALLGGGDVEGARIGVELAKELFRQSAQLDRSSTAFTGDQDSVSFVVRMDLLAMIICAVTGGNVWRFGGNCALTQNVGGGGREPSLAEQRVISRRLAPIC